MLVQADARALPLPSGWVQTVITSPPYWGLRDYGQTGQIGLEATPEDYVADLVTVFKEVWRVLRDDGTAWLNLGDTYCNSDKWGGGGANTGKHTREPDGIPASWKAVRRHWSTIEGVKPKDLVGIPWRVAFALQADGWYLRSDIIWAKPNPMPESVTDRPTRAHEYLFLLTKKSRYFYDAEAVKETSTNRSSGNQRRKLASGAEGQRVNDHLGSSVPYVPNGSGRNRRSVWTITPKPFRGAHFATFPPELVEPCLRAGSPPVCCGACGRAYQRVIEKGNPLRDQQLACGSNDAGEYVGTAQKDFAVAGAQDASAVKARILAGMVERRTLGWRPACACDAPPAQSVVFDPFCGSGTTGLVASREGRFFIGCDLKPEYLQLAQDRIRTAVPGGDPPVLLPRL